MNITVYLGASNGNDQNLILASRELGKWIGENGHTLVYGGSKCGLMGELAESVLKAKGKVIGVEPQFFIDAGFDYPEITQLIVTQDMSERKAKMIELGDAFIAFPGGTGTLEEITEVIYEYLQDDIYELRQKIQQIVVLHEVVPNKAFFAAIRDFHDRISYSMNSEEIVDDAWEELYDRWCTVIWAEEAKKYNGIQKEAVEWNTVVAKLKENNYKENFCMIK